MNPQQKPDNEVAKKDSNETATAILAIGFFGLIAVLIVAPITYDIVKFLAYLKFLLK